ncbi:hypothetical protein Bpfe_028692 [Biomphalaria pfeifferi]|uniref:Uncharacterized protein n=1 Tax=Biomphalaria pfeifferi TaxID=112525 RepID=A0AAD8EWD2_BIOPF|nr:hypothetical protein Bpfe_028692 [Biomphalaria pfeifferi]
MALRSSVGRDCWRPILAISTQLWSWTNLQDLSCARQPWIPNQYGSSFFSRQRLLASYTSNFNTAMELDELTDFQVQQGKTIYQK